MELNVTNIKWKVDDTGEVNLTMISLEWSSNFSNPLIIPYLKCDA